jgi:hypothetical protein
VSFDVPNLLKIMVVWRMRRYLMLLKTSIVDFVCCRRSASMVLGGDVIALSRNKRETVEGVEASQSTSHEER